MTRPTRQRGFTAIEVAVTIVILAIVMSAVASATSQWRRGQMRLAEQRADLRRAEAAVLALQTGQPVQAATGEDVRLTVEPVAPPAGEQAPQGSQWVRVTAAHGDRAVNLLVLVPADAAMPKGDAP